MKELSKKLVMTSSWKTPMVCIQFEIIINVLVSSFRFIWIPVLRIYDHYDFSKFFQYVDIGIWLTLFYYHKTIYFLEQIEHTRLKN